jgi:hypothetical protein
MALRCCSSSVTGKHVTTIERIHRTVTIYPSLGDHLYTTTVEELRRVYAWPKASNIRVGTLYQDAKLPAYVLTDELLGKHFAILGTTGSGKSCSTTLILKSILVEYPHRHIVLLDPHNEYGKAFGERAEVLNPTNLQLPYWLLNFEEMCGVMIDHGRADSESQIEILANAVVERSGSVCLNSLADLISGPSAGFRPLRQAAG